MKQILSKVGCFACANRFQGLAKVVRMSGWRAADSSFCKHNSSVSNIKVKPAEEICDIPNRVSQAYKGWFQDPIDLIAGNP